MEEEKTNGARTDESAEAIAAEAAQKTRGLASLPERLTALLAAAIAASY